MSSRCAFASRIFAVLLAPFVLSTAAADPGPGEVAGPWQTYQAITSVGDVSKTAPTGTKHLHFNGGSSGPETASFAIDVSNANDQDRREITCASTGEFLRWEAMNAGIHNADTTWTCTAPGSIADGGITTTYTPGSTIQENVAISSTVKEGHVYSYADSNFDTTVTKNWAETLKVFRVGVRYEGTNSAVIWEDSTDTALNVREVNNSPQLLGLECAIEGDFWGQPETQSASGTTVTKTVKWKPVANAGGDDINNIQKGIKFSQEIQANGKFTLTNDCESTHVPFTSSTIAAVLQGVPASPYKAALAVITSWIPTETCTVSEAVFAAETVLENVTDKEINTTKQHWHDDESVTINLSALTISGPLVSLAPGTEVNGSLAMLSKLGTYDDTIMEYADVELELTEAGGVEFVCTRPTYSN